MKTILAVCLLVGVAVASEHPCSKIYFPTCGANGKIYDNPCLLKNAEVEESQDWELCRHLNHPLCPSRCTREYNPVCASDGLVYSNPCVLHFENCGKRLEVRAMEECQVNE